MAPVAVPIAPVVAVAPASSTFRALAWSDAEQLPESARAEPDAHGDEPGYEPYDPRPQLAFTDQEAPEEGVAATVPWFRRPVAMLAIGGLAVLLAAGGAAFYLLRDDETPVPAVTATTTAPPTSEAPQPSSEAPPPTDQAPDQTVYQQAPPPVVTVTQEPPPVSEAPPPPSTPDAPPPTTDPTTVTVTATPTTQSQAPGIPTLPYQTIPGLPFVPAPIQPPSP